LASIAAKTPAGPPPMMTIFRDVIPAQARSAISMSST
jgi:hypothetical protein